MRDVDDNAHPLTPTDDLDPEGCQPAMDRRFGLDVAELIDPVVSQLQMAQPAESVSGIQVCSIALEKVGTFGGDQRCRTSGPSGCQRSSIRCNPQFLRTYEGMKASKASICTGPQFSRLGFRNAWMRPSGPTRCVGMSDTTARHTTESPPANIGFASGVKGG